MRRLLAEFPQAGEPDGRMSRRSLLVLTAMILAATAASDHAKEGCRAKCCHCSSSNVSTKASIETTKPSQSCSVSNFAKHHSSD
jgi:hypothetical protein